MKLGTLEIECAILDSGERVLSQRAFSAALGVIRSGAIYRAGGGDNLPHFLAHKALKSFIDIELAAEISSPLRYIPKHGGRAAYGVKAELIPRVCDVWLRARAGGALRSTSALAIAAKAEILVSGLAHVGIIALVDEATGYQDDRARDALAKILEPFVAKELRKWVITFQADFYKEMFRLRGLPYDGTCQRPQYFGYFTNDLVYSRLAPGVLRELQTRNPAIRKGVRKAKHHQWLTEEIGYPKLEQHLAAVTALMKASEAWDGFYALLEKALPKQVDLPLLDGVGTRHIPLPA